MHPLGALGISTSINHCKCMWNLTSLVILVLPTVGIVPPSSNVRLVNGTSSFAGRLEVFHNGKWGTVCDDGANNTTANVVCQMLGYNSGEVTQEFGAGTGRIWMDDVYCLENETSLFDCQHGGWGVHNCYHSEDVGVVCYNNLGNENLLYQKN